MNAPMLPYWEDSALKYGWTPSLDADSADDPAYLAFRLQEEMRVAREFAANYDGGAAYWRGTTQDRDALELALLRKGLERLIEEALMLTATADEFFAVLHAIVPELEWQRGLSRRFFAYSHCATASDAEQVTERCARRLRLREKTPSNLPGRRAWEGIIEGWQVHITLKCVS